MKEGERGGEEGGEEGKETGICRRRARNESFRFV